MKSTIIALLTLPVLLTSCAVSDGPVRNRSRAKFLDQVWVAPALRGKAVSDVYSSVYFAPVGISKLSSQDWWSAQNARTKESLAADARQLAVHTTRSLKRAADTYPGKRMKVVGSPGPGTLIVESSIVELVPAKAFWNSAASLAGFAVPGAGLLGTFGKGSITFEGRLRDGATGQVLATFRDRSTDKTAVVNVNSYTWYGGSVANIEELAHKTAEVLNTPKGTIVSESGPIQLIAY